MISMGGGLDHSLFFTSSGGVWVAGGNSRGQMAIEEKKKVEALHPHLLPSSLFGGERVIKVACGRGHSLFLTEHSRVLSCGNGRAWSTWYW